MTRENKLALVVGFGLLLLVGILVSDHFSPARVESAEDLRAGRGPEAAARPSWMRTPDVPASPGPNGPGGTAGTAEEDAARAAIGVPGPGPRPRLAADDRTRADRAADPPVGVRPISNATGGTSASPPPQPVSTRPRVVTRGETFESIAKEVYGDRGLAKDLARFNGIDDPRRLRAGATIQLPPLALLRRDGTGPRPAAAGEGERPTASAWRTYVVRRGDTLSEIARRELGRRDWQVILEVNRDVLAHAEDLRPGMTLRLPPRRG